MINPYGYINPEFSGDYLADLCKGENGIQTGPFGSLLHREDYVDIGTPIITVEHLGDNGRISRNNLPLVSDEDKKRLSKFVLKKGDIVFSRVGSVDRNALVTSEEDGWLFSGRCLRVRPDTKRLDPAYLSYFLSLSQFKHYISRMAVGGTMPSLNTQILSRIPIFYPPLTEQRKIAEILSTWDEAIALTEQLIAALQKRKKGLMQRLLTGQVRFPGFEGEWKKEKLEKIVLDFIGGGTPSTKIAQYWNGSVPWISSSDFDELKIKNIHRFVTNEAIHASAAKIAAKGSVLVVTRVGVGKVAIAPCDIAFSQDTTALIPNVTLVDTMFLLYALHWTIPSLLRYNQGTSINGITRKDLRQHILLVPPVPEQRKIAELLQTCDAEIELHERKLAALRQQKKGLMQQLLTGQVRVKVGEEVGRTSKVRPT